MKHRLYIDNLPLTVTLASLTEFVSSAGKIDSINIVIDGRTGGPEGHAFVEMHSPEDAMKAVQTLNGKKLEGHEVTVTHAGPISGISGFSGSSNSKERKNR